MKKKDDMLPPQPTKKPKIIPIESPCPCGSGKAIASCHLDVDGRLRKPRPSLLPPAPPTKFSHPGCYLKDSGDCSQQLSREHYLSKSILLQLGVPADAPIRVAGMPWLKPDQTMVVSADNLTAKILCDRHNSALSPLDAEAASFFSILTKTLGDLERKTLSRKSIFHLASGDALELWMLNVACGIYFSVASKDGEKLSKTHHIDMQRVRRAFFAGGWDARGGLYFCAAPGSAITVEGHVVVAPLTSDQANDLRFSGVRVSPWGFTLELLFDTTAANPGPWTALVRRPTELVLKRNRRQHVIFLTWPSGAPEASVTMECPQAPRINSKSI